MKLLNEGQAPVKVAEVVAEELNFGDNMRASGAYRKHLAKVLVRRSLEELMTEGK